MLKLTSYTSSGSIIERESNTKVAAARTEALSRYLSACSNACRGLDIDRIESLDILAIVLENQRLRELASTQQVQIAELEKIVVEYEKALNTKIASSL